MVLCYESEELDLTKQLDHVLFAARVDHDMLDGNSPLGPLIYTSDDSAPFSMLDHLLELVSLLLSGSPLLTEA